MRIIGKRMHIDRANQVPMPGKLAGAAGPMSAFGLVSMPTYRTPTRCASFRAGEAHDVSSLAFVCEIINVLAIFPQGHALIVKAATVFLPDAMRIPDEEGADLLFDTEVDHFPGGFVPQVTNTAFGTTTLLVLGTL